jgi:hypothetical protein
MSITDDCVFWKCIEMARAGVEKRKWGRQDYERLYEEVRLHGSGKRELLLWLTDLVDDASIDMERVKSAATRFPDGPAGEDDIYDTQVGMVLEGRQAFERMVCSPESVERNDWRRMFFNGAALRDWGPSLSE